MADIGAAVRPARRPVAWVLLAAAIGVIAGVGSAYGGLGPGLLVAGATVAGLSIVRAPGLVLGAYLLVPFYKGALQPLLPVDLTVILAILNALQVVPIVIDRRTRSVARIGLILWVAVGCLVLGGVIYAPDQQLALGRAVNFWVLVFVPLVPAAMRVAGSEVYVRQLLWTMFAMGALVVLLGVPAVVRSERLVVLGMNTIQTARAALLVPVIGIAFVLRRRFAPLEMATLGLVAGAILVALATGARGPVLMLGVLAALAALRHVAGAGSVDRRRTALLAILLVASVGVVSIGVVDLPEASAERIATLGATIGRSLDPTSVGQESRMSLYGVAVELFAGSPVLGAGTAGYEAFSDRSLPLPEASAYPHNALLQFAAEYGLVGVVLFVGLASIGLTRPLPAGATWGAVRAAFAFFLLNAMVSGNVLEDRTMWGLLLLIVFASVPAVVEEAQPSEAIRHRGQAPRVRPAPASAISSPTRSMSSGP